MNARLAFFVASVLLALVGCSSPNKHVIGVWEGKVKGTPITLTLNADSSYTANSSGDTAHGRWTSSDTEVNLFKDLRDSKGGAIGDSQSSKMKFSEVEGTLTLLVPNDSPIVFHKSKS